MARRLRTTVCETHLLTRKWLQVSCKWKLSRLYDNRKHCYSLVRTECYANANTIFDNEILRGVLMTFYLQPLSINGDNQPTKQSRLNICQAFNFIGCQANGNNFTSVEEF